MTKFIQENINYPKKAIEYGIKGKVYVLFSVDIDGKLGDFEIVKSADPLLDKEALRVVKLLPNFIPA